MIIDEGSYILENGDLITAGLSEITETRNSFSFPITFVKTPVIFSQVNSYHSDTPVVCRAYDVTEDSFHFKLQYETESV